jgi:hypothetical protein
MGELRVGSPTRLIHRSDASMDSGSAVLTMCTSLPFPCYAAMIFPAGLDHNINEVV